MLTTFDLVWMAAERRPNHLALVDDRTDRRLTFRQLIDEIEMVATGLTARSINYGMRAATVLPSTFDHCIALLALARLGAVPALINFRLRPKDIARLIADGGMAAAIVGADDELATAVASALPYRPRCSWWEVQSRAPTNGPAVALGLMPYHHRQSRIAKTGRSSFLYLGYHRIAQGCRFGPKVN